MKSYRWTSPNEWLSDQLAATDDPAKLRGYLTAILDLLDPDMLQDVFQTEMEQDGYFQSTGVQS